MGTGLGTLDRYRCKVGTQYAKRIEEDIGTLYERKVAKKVSKPCVVSVNGTDYYAPCDRIEYLFVDGNRLYNSHSQSITLYGSLAVYGDSSSGYPRITCPTYTTAYYRSSYNANNNILNVSSFDVGYRTFGTEIYLLIVILGVMLCRLFKR